MRHAWLATLLLGLAIGFLAGRGTAPQPGPSRSVPARQTAVLPAPAPRPVAVPAREPEPAPALPTEDVCPVPGRLPPEEGHGTLVVDFTGVGAGEPSFSVPVALLNGDVVRYEGDWLSESPDLVSLELRPGTYHPSWTLPGRIGRFGRPAVIEAGRVTRLNAGAPADALPLPPLDGTGRLHVRVLSAEGVPVPGLPVALEGDLEAFDDKIEGWTDSAGVWSVDARPGAATLRVGNHVAPVHVRLGRTDCIEVHPVDTGDLRFELPEGAWSYDFALRRADERQGYVRSELHRCNWPGFQAYLAPGEYEVRWRHGGDSVIGTAWVRAGEETRFAGPSGCLSVRCPCGAEHLRGYEFSVSRRGERDWRFLTKLERGWDRPSSLLLVVPWLEPGLYRVEVRNLHANPQVAEVEVGYSERDCVLPPPE